MVSARAQLDAANALYQQTGECNGVSAAVGLVAQIDVNKNQVQALTQQQRLATLQNDLAKQKINLARLIGLPSNCKRRIDRQCAVFRGAPGRGRRRGQTGAGRASGYQSRRGPDPRRRAYHGRGSC